MDNSFIITPDKILSLATNWISRYDTKIDDNPKNNIYFIKPDFMKDFYNYVLPKINYPFVLLTHDSDIPAPVPGFESILDNQYLIKWFGMNCHVIHDKLQPIPIGMANEVWPHGDKNVIIKIIQENNKKENLVYCNFEPSTNFNDRNYALQILNNDYYKKFIDFEKEKLPYENYIRKLSTYKYVISPPGNSIDCHRIWESMYVGTIPICLKQIPMVYFKDCPIFFIDNWDKWKRDDLIDKYEELKNRQIEKSNFNFYKDMIIKTSQEA